MLLSGGKGWVHPTTVTLYHRTVRMLCRSDSDRQRATRPVRHRSRYDGGAHRAHSTSESDAVS